MKFSKPSIAAAALFAASVAVAAPQVSDVAMLQPIGSRMVTITYRLSEPAIVTLEVFTNAVPNAATGWTSIGGEAVCTAQGAVWRKVTDADAVNGTYTITWRPDLSWKDDEGNGLNAKAGCAKARVTAWALDNPPDYMVVDISTDAQPDTQRYYPAVDFLPGAEPGQHGAITNNHIYKTSMLVMRKIPAQGVTWTAGSLASETSRHQYGRENIRHVTFTNNYYMAVFETTQAQWDLIQTERQSPSYFNNTAWRDYRPVEQVCYNEIRMAANNKDADPNAEEWPERPYAGSFLGLLSDKTGIDFDLPTEAQWEFAARAGHGSPYWGDGTAIKNSHNDSNLNLLGRYALNGGWVDSGTSASGASAPAANCDTSRGTAWVGSYKPNSWGLYDMHGNVFEWSIDWFRNVLTTENGYVADPYGTPIAYEYRNYDQRAIRGGSFGGTNSGDADGYFGRSGHCRPAWRQYRRPDYRENFIGFRVVCPADFQN